MLATRSRCRSKKVSKQLVDLVLLALAPPALDLPYMCTAMLTQYTG